MAAPKAVLAIEDHYILRMLIQGKSVEQVAESMHVGIRAVNKRMDRMREFLEVETNYQLVALEVINLMESAQDVTLSPRFEPQLRKARAVGA